MNKIKKIYTKITSFLNRDIGWIEWMIYTLVSTFMFLFFQHGDIIGTAESSFLLLDGNVLNFYDAAAKFSDGHITANYLLPTFILFAIWNIPLKIIGKQPMIWGESGFLRIMWYKALPTMCFVLSAYFFYKVLIEIGFNKKNAKLGLFLYLSMPFAMFSQYMFGQYDSFTLLFMVLGLYYYFKYLNGDNQFDWWKFVFCMAIGMTFKTFLFAYFLPLILLREKRVKQLITSLVVFIIPYLCFKIPFRSSSVFDEGINNFNAADFVKRVTLSNGTESIQLLPILFAIFCAYIYFVNVKDKDSYTKWVTYSGCMVSVMLFGIMHWHPQWLILSVAFLTLGTLLSKRYDVFLLLDIVATFFYMAYVLNADWVDRINTWLATGGILGEKLLGYSPQIFPWMFFPVDNPSQAFSYLAAVIFVFGFFRHPKYCIEAIENQNVSKVFYVRLRFVLCSVIILVPFLFSIWSSFHSSRIIRMTTSATYSHEDAISKYAMAEQIFIAPYDMKCRQVTCRLNVPESADSGIKLEIYDYSAEDVLMSAYYTREQLSANAIFDFSEVQLHEGVQYGIRFSSDSEPWNCSTLIGTRSFKAVGQSPTHAFYQDESKDYNYAIVLYEKDYEEKE